jgi:hypothetical protein
VSVLVKRLAEILDRAAGFEGENRLNVRDIEIMAGLYAQVQPKSVVDIGTYRGKSAKIWKYLGAETVYSIDKEPVTVEGIECITGDSSLIPWDKSVDLVWIDGDHSYPGVKADLCKWMPWAQLMICGHDYHEKEPGAMRAVDEFFGGLAKKQGIVWFVDKTDDLTN